MLDVGLPEVGRGLGPCGSGTGILLLLRLGGLRCLLRAIALLLDPLGLGVQLRTEHQRSE